MEYIDRSCMQGMECTSGAEWLRLDSRSRESMVGQTAQKIMTELMKFQRLSGPQTSCAQRACSDCMKPHIWKIVSAITSGQPVRLLLPAFPAKSPNVAKVLGPLPDMGEKLALVFLQQICNRIRDIYPPGAQVLLCSDGRVFNDVVGILDEDVSLYQYDLQKIIDHLGLRSISLINLESFYKAANYKEMRQELLFKHGESIDFFQSSVSRGGKSGAKCEDRALNRLYCGITRFLVEDANVPGQLMSRSALQRECRHRAYEVVRRSQAWGSLLETQFPGAVRLSIHPQSCGSRKLGIHLSHSNLCTDHWLTPWHGVAVQVGGRFTLLKREQAERLGARLIFIDGQASHFVLEEKKLDSSK